MPCDEMPTTKFIPSAEQQKVIDDRGGHLRDIACAGAGKIEAISRRMASLIDEGIEPCQTIAFIRSKRVIVNA